MWTDSQGIASLERFQNKKKETKAANMTKISFWERSGKILHWWNKGRMKKKKKWTIREQEELLGNKKYANENKNK